MVEKSFGRAHIFCARRCPVGIIAGERPTADSNTGRPGSPSPNGRTGMNRVATLLADAASDRAAGNAQLLLWGGVLVAVLLIGAVILAKLDRWRKRMDEPEDAGNALSAFRLSYEEGEISEEEYKRIRARLTGTKPALPKDKPDAPPAPPS
jgi:hypothetical protein